MDDAIAQALAHDRVIDITTTGRRSGVARRIEIWFFNLDDSLFLTGAPGNPRHWYRNLCAHPEFTVHLKQSATADLPALARAELVALGAPIESCDSEAADNAIVTAHLRDLSARIEAALDHRATRAAPSATPAPTGRRRAGSEDSPDRGWCSVPLEPQDD